MNERTFSSNNPLPGRLAGVDFGTVRVGLAITDPSQSLASPLDNYTRRGAAADERYFKELAKQERIVRFVVGLPVHTNGAESQKSREARDFGNWIHQITGVEVVFFDERYTSSQAEQLLMEAGLTSKRRKQRLDKLAAQILLSAYLESTQRDASLEGLDD